MKFLGLALGLLLAADLSAAMDAAALLRDAATLPEAALTKEADHARRTKIVTVIDKPAPSPTGDNHDYVSYARYYWPDPTKPDGLPYVSRDGQHNHAQVAAGDRAKLDVLVDNVTALAVGWSRLHRAEDAQRAGDWLRAWFITPATRMKPALDYAQVRLGRDENRGSAAGVLDARGFAELVQALRLLQDSPALTPDETAAVRAWFADYFHWLQTGKSAVGEHHAKNNHGSWYLVQAVAIARYLGETDSARKLCEEDFTRIEAQFRPDGSQPMELTRADALHYSRFNLEAQLQLARQARELGVELWHFKAPNGASLKGGVEYLRPYNAAPETWSGKEQEKLPPGFLDELLAQAAALDARSH